MICADFHLHTEFSTDSDASPISQVEAAKKAGLSCICFTDHMDPDYPGGKFEVDMDSYYPAIQKLAEDKKEEIEILTGIELGLRTDKKDRLLECASHYPWDFIIGSTHVVDADDPYYPQYWEKASVQQSVHRFYEVTLDNILMFDCFDVYGHLDYILRYIPKEKLAKEGYDANAERDIIDEILKALITRGKGIECNVSGLRYGVGEPHPASPILSRYFELGGKILTIGSDAHKPEHLAFAYDKLPALLKACGAKEYCIFKQRRPTFFSL